MLANLLFNCNYNKKLEESKIIRLSNDNGLYVTYAKRKKKIFTKKEKIKFYWYEKDVSFPFQKYIKRLVRKHENTEIFVLIQRHTYDIIHIINDGN